MGQRKRRGLGQLLVKSRDLEFNDWLARLLVSYSELTLISAGNDRNYAVMLGKESNRISWSIAVRFTKIDFCLTKVGKPLCQVRWPNTDDLHFRF
jgi:hypothetical protein